MNDETFGPETRRPINPNEFQQESQSEHPQQEYQEGLPPQLAARVTGNVPPEVLARLNKNQQDTSPMRVTEGSRMQQKPQQQYKEQMRVTGSPELEDVLGVIKDKSFTYEKITLPSLGKFYDGDDGPMDGILHIRPMTGEEEEILATPRLVKSGNAINMIFSNCMREKHNTENFLSVDRTFLLIWLRGISYSPSYQVELTCPFTDKKFSHTIDLNLDVELCPDDFNESALEGVLPRTELPFKYRLARGKDELAMQAHRDKKAKFDNSTKTDDSLIFRTAQLVENIAGLTNKRELEICLKKLPVEDGNFIRNLVNDPPFGVQTKVTVESPFSLEEFEVELPLDSNFFFPRRLKTE